MLRRSSWRKKKPTSTKRRVSKALMSGKKALIGLGVAVLAVAAFGVLLVQTMRLPKPQSAFVQGELAPDFTLQDENGQPFHLASTRGSRVVLIFYRGYW